MKIVVIGGTGLIGTKLVQALTEHGHDAVAAAPSTGVNAVTGEGVVDALRGAHVVVDVSNSPSFEEAAATEFFTTSTTNLLRAETQAGVGHHVALSVVGTDHLARQSGYFRAKLTQEKLIAAGPVPYSIVRATQFFEFLESITDSATVAGTVRLPDKLIQPMAAADVAEAVAITAVNAPLDGTTEVGGPEPFRLTRPHPHRAHRPRRRTRDRRRPGRPVLGRRPRRAHPGARRRRGPVRYPIRGLDPANRRRNTT